MIISETSLEAREVAEDFQIPRILQIVRCIHGLGNPWLMDQEIDRLLRGDRPTKANTLRPRRLDCWRMGLVETHPTERKLTDAGRKASIHRLTLNGLRLAVAPDRPAIQVVEALIRDNNAAVKRMGELNKEARAVTAAWQRDLIDHLTYATEIELWVRGL
jgi:hypothetical protein